MTDGEKKRQRIFDIYSTNLKFLIDNQIILRAKPQTKIYICPICLGEFDNINDEKNPLTLEDAPPKSLGGKADILTCKKCNNTCGHKIDFHLTERLREIDEEKLPAGSEIKVKIQVNNETLNATISPNEDGTISVFHSNKNNNPEKLSNQMLNLEGNALVNMEYLKSRIIPENLEYALLKTGYLLSFKKFGYSLLFEECFNQVREQLLNPEKKIYPSGFWFTHPYFKGLSGVHFLIDDKFEGLLSIFDVKTQYSERTFGVILPLPITEISHVINNIKLKLQKEKKFLLGLYQNNNSYLEDKENLKIMRKWIATKKNIS